MAWYTYSDCLSVFVISFPIKSHSPTRIRGRYPQQLLRHLPTFQTHDVILHIVPGKEVHTAVPDDFLIDHSKMLAGIFGILNFKPCRPKAFQ